MSTAIRTALITGTSSGFGKSTTRMLAAAGWNVIATMRDPQDHFSDLPNVLVSRLDVNDEASITRSIAMGIDRFGKLDALVNNAGGLLMGPFEAVSEAKARAIFETNTFGVMNVTRQILPHFRSQGHGVLVNISSAVALVPPPLFTIYAASKCAIEGFSEALAYELAPLNIRVKLVEPGAALTGITSRVMEEAATLPHIADYGPLLAHVQKLNEELFSKGMSGPDPIAEVIVRAVTDGSSQLRYLACDDFTETLEARKALDEESFLGQLRARYLPR